MAPLTLPAVYGQTRSAIAQAGEDAALAEYRRCGYRSLARNWCCHLGEIDLVVQRGRTVVFCEVKTRTALGLGHPFEAVGWRKRRKVRLLAEAFLDSARLVPEQVRFDVASVLMAGGNAPIVHLYPDAF